MVYHYVVCAFIVFLATNEDLSNIQIRVPILTSVFYGVLYQDERPPTGPTETTPLVREEQRQEHHEEQRQGGDSWRTEPRTSMELPRNDRWGFAPP